jgi:hypothetical protein
MRFSVLTTAFFCAAVTAWAEPQVNAYIQRQTVSVGKPFVFFIEASGGDVGAPDIPEVDGLNINKQASNTSSSTQINVVNGQMSTVNTRRLGFYAQAKRPGKITIPPIGVPIDGKTVYTKAIIVNAQDASGGPTAPDPQQQQQQQQPGAQAAMPVGAQRQQNNSSREPTWEDAAFIESDVSQRSAYQGEAIVLMLRVWALSVPGLQVGNYRGQQFQYPASDGFYATTLEPQKERRDRNGWSYEVTIYRQVLYPTKSGDLSIGAWHWEGVGQYGGGWTGQQKELAFDAPPIPVTVKPLPERPDDFSGAVGSFDISAELSHSQLVQGVPSQLIVKISGKGNPDALNSIVLPKIDNVQLSDPEKNVKPNEVGGAISFEKTFTYALTPLTAGALTIPEIPFCYFDPGAQGYQTKKTAPITVPVVLAAESSAPKIVVAPAELPTNGNVDIVGEDIVPIVSNPGRIRPVSAFGKLAPTFIILGPGFGCAAFGAFMRRRRRFEQDSGFARDYKAKTKGLKRLSGVAQSADPSDELYKAVAGYVADKFNIPEAAITSGDIAGLFGERGLDDDLREGFTRILKACERARYAGVRLSSDEISALIDAGAIAMDRLDEQLKRRRGK